MELYFTGKIKKISLDYKEKTNKKIIASLLVSMMMLSLVACGNNNDTAVDNESGLSGKVTVYMPSPAGVIYNTLVVPELSADWNELALPEYKDFVAGYVNANDWDNLEAIAGNEIEI